LSHLHFQRKIDIFSVNMMMDSDFLRKNANNNHFTKHHVQRIYLLGDNLPENKWFINIDLINLKEISLIREQIDGLRKVY